FENLCHDLIRHEAMEHKVWYPCLKDNEKLDSTVKHLLTEEKSAEEAIKEFDDIKTQQEWEKKFARFKNNVIRHAEEEENKLFPQVKIYLITMNWK
uniref:hemerythrin domain-containing protein n=1 Tax=Legionella tunisiensis TaxID=1034944 RepID=UPI0003698E9B